jgi:uncharacterized membrane protein YoaK (UPF0700 family)
VLVVLLTVVTGATDAIGFLHLGGVFTSVMTANMVLLGISGPRHDGSLALHSGVALVGYVAGSGIGALVAGRPTGLQPAWPRRITAALLLELGVFGVFAVWWELAAGHPSAKATYVLIGVNAIALGTQSSAVLRFGLPGLSTTYLTGTLTQVVASVARRKAQIPTRSVAVLLALIIGALIGAVLSIEVPRAAPALPLGVLVVVLVIAMRVLHGASDIEPHGTSDAI